MTYWLTSQNRKRHQREMNRIVRKLNKQIQQDSLWQGRFVIRQIESQWIRYEDGSGTELWVKLKFIDRATGRYYVGAHTVNQWRGLRANGWRVFEIMNWLITEHWNVWNEELPQQGKYQEWREYNKTVRKV